MTASLALRHCPIVSAWATEQRLVLAQSKVQDKSNEITAIPALLELLVIIGCIVTLDAMGTQKSIAALLFSRRKPTTSSALKPIILPCLSS